MRQRARSAGDKAQRSEDLLAAAEELILELGGVRYVTLAQVTERAGLHRTGVRRYYASKEELLLELAERGWNQWRDAVAAELKEGHPGSAAGVLSRTLIALPVFCDLLTHVTLSLEGDVDVERARRYKTNAFAAHDEMVGALAAATTMTPAQLVDLIATALALASTLWQVAHPTPTLAGLYEQVPRWGHVALDFAPHLTRLLEAAGRGLSQAPPAAG